MTPEQKSMIEKTGTIDEFTDYCVNQIPEMAVKDVLDAIKKYRQKFRDAGKIDLSTIQGNVKVPLQPTNNMLRAGVDVGSAGAISEPAAWDFLARAWPVMVAQFAQDSKVPLGIRDDVHELITYLTSIAEADPFAMGALISHRVHCNNAMLMHPTVQCGTTEDGGQVGMLGILNGYAGKFRDGRYKGWGPIAAVMEKNGNVSSFQYTDVPWSPPKEQIDVTSFDDKEPKSVDGKSTSEEDSSL